MTDKEVTDIIGYEITDKAREELTLLKTKLDELIAQVYERAYEEGRSHGYEEGYDAS